MATSNPYGSGKYKLNFGRAVSKKWKTADKVDYGGGWGDDDSDDGVDSFEPQPADNPRYPAWGAPPGTYPSNRSVTNPSPSRVGQRPSFDQGEERRHFSSGGGFDSAYPTTQRPPFPDPQHDRDPRMPGFGPQPPLRVNTQPQGPVPASGFRPGSRGRQYPPNEDAPFSAPGGFPQQRRSDSSNPPPSDIYQRHESPMRPESRSSTSNASHRQYPPRQMSLTQVPLPTDLTQRSNSPALSHASGPGNTTIGEERATPIFIRPSDIYKRMGEEMEKARRSQESSRPSIDSGPNRVREGSVGARSTSSDPKDSTSNVQTPAEDSDSNRRLKTTLDPVPERKSEYGFENLTKPPSQDTALAQEPSLESEALGVSRHGTTASSVYTDRPDPISAGSMSRNVSLTEGIPEAETSSDVEPSFGLPPIDRMSGLGMDIEPPGISATQTAQEVSHPANNKPPQLPSKVDSYDHTLDDQVGQGLRHQPTMGYTSVVNQAFDQSQSQQPFSPTSTSGTVDRSNSASTADISPIISRKPEPGPPPAVVPIAHTTIPEESLWADSRPTSSTTLRADEAHAFRDVDLGSSAPIRSGYRRETTPPRRDNSPAKRPLEFSPQETPQAQHGSFVAANAMQPATQETNNDRVLQDKPLPAEPKVEGGNISDLNMPPMVPRSESPPKGTVRDLAGRLESTSGRSSPNNPLSGVPQARPAPQTRFDSFRPTIPGGWQSYASSTASGTPGTSSPTPAQIGMSAPRAPFAQARAESTESIPTARAPTNYDSEGPGISQRAFAAAATAGSVLAGALVGHGLTTQTHDSPEPSEEDSVNEWDASSSSGDDHVPSSMPREDIEQAGTTHPSSMAREMQLPEADSSSYLKSEQPLAVAATMPSSDSVRNEMDMPQSTHDDFPAPLRTSRLFDTSTSRPSIPDVSVSQETPPENDNERLQEEIVKSLTPKSSNLGSEASNHGSAFDQPTTPAIAPPFRSSAPQAKTDVPSNETAAAGTPLHPATLNLQSSTVPPKDVVAVPNISTDNSRIGQAHTEQKTPPANKPFLQQRFSWETGSSQPPSASTPNPTSPPSTGSPDTIRVAAESGLRSAETTPRKVETIQSATEQVNPPSQQQRGAAIGSPFEPHQASRTLTNHAQTSQASRTSPGEPPTFRAILNLGSPAERIKAFDASRNFYAAPNDQLQGWLMSMKTPENAELFATNGRLSVDANDGAASHKPSPRRMLTESAGARHMQEDGKKLMAAAGRFGGKAGHAAKGFFAKGKEKMRNASSSEKGTFANRRKSTTPLPDEAEQGLSPSSSRDIKAVEGPPQIPLSITPASPLTSPTEWFSTRDLKESQSSGLNHVWRPPTASSKPPDVDAATKPDAERVEEAPLTTEKPSGAPVLSTQAPSPAISALDSEQEQIDDENGPSRSISQLTKPPDQSPLEPPQGANVEKSPRDSHGAAVPRATTSSTDDDSGLHTLVPPKPFTDRREGSASDAESSDRSLQVPQDRRRSMVSDVSSPSPSNSLGNDAEGQHLRRSVSLSPADEVPVTSVLGLRQVQHVEPEVQIAPITLTGVASQSSGVLNDHVDEAQDMNIPPPATVVEPPNNEDSESAQNAKEPQPLVEQQPQSPDPGQQRAQKQNSTVQHRPFSFAGIEIAEGREQDLNRIPSQPMSPVSQGRSSIALSKEMSQVSVEEVTDSTDVPGQRYSRSYSRPFGVDPNVRNHPALRAGEPEQPAVDRAQMYSSESPLPSARRPQQEPGRVRPQKEQQQPSAMHQHQPSTESGYRIPGPYVQEYRSPKQISMSRNGRSHAQVEASGNQLPSTLKAQRQSYQSSPQPQSRPTSYLGTERPVSQSYRDGPPPMTTPRAYSEYETKQGGFPSHAQEQPAPDKRQSVGPLPGPAQPPPGQLTSTAPPSERRRSKLGKLFGVSSKSSRLQKQSPVERPENSQKEKRASMLRRNESVSSQQSSKHGSQDQLGRLPSSSLPSHSTKRQSRDMLRAPTPEGSEKPSEGKKKRFSGFGGKLFKSSNDTRATTAPTQDMVSTAPGPQSMQDPRVRSPDPYSAHTPHTQYPAGPGSYFNQSQGQPQYAQMPYQQHPQSGSFPYPQSPPPQTQQQPAGPYPPGNYPYINPSQGRPSDLRIDTSSQAYPQHNVPATAPAQLQPPSSTSFDSVPYNPKPSPNAMTTNGPTSAPPHTPQTSSQNPRSHVIDLHKRSRSPRMGRPTSDDLDAEARQERQSLSGTANHLGTFSSKKISPVGGIPRSEDDQERPFAITMPGLDEGGSELRRKQQLRDRIEGGVAANRSGMPMSVESSGGLDRNVSVLEGYNDQPMSPREARRYGAKDKSTPGAIAELPGSKAGGYESDEEIPMSATAYPGQEWVPVFVGDGRWDD